MNYVLGLHTLYASLKKEANCSKEGNHFYTKPTNRSKEALGHLFFLRAFVPSCLRVKHRFLHRLDDIVNAGNAARR